MSVSASPSRRLVLPHGLRTDVYLACGPVALLLLMLPIGVARVAALTLTLALQVVLGSAVVRVGIPSLAAQPLLRAALSLAVGPVVTAMVRIGVSAAGAYGRLGTFVAVALATLVLARGRRIRHVSADAHATDASAIVFGVLGIACAVAASAYLWLLVPAVLSLLFSISRDQATRRRARAWVPVSVGAAAGLVAVGRIAMRLGSSVREPLDLVNASADGLHFEAWSSSLVARGPFDDVFKAGSRISYHWLSFGLAGTWADLAAASKWEVSALAINVLALVLAVLAVLGWLKCVRPARSDRALVAWGILALCTASMLETAFVVPLDSPSQALSIGLLVSAIALWVHLRRIDGPSPDRWMGGLLVAMLAAATFLAKASTGFALLLYLVSATALGVEPRSFVRSSERIRILRHSMTLIAASTAIGVTYVFFIRDPMGFSYGNVTLHFAPWRVDSATAILGYLSLPFSSGTVVLFACALVWSLRIGVLSDTRLELTRDRGIDLTLTVIGVHVAALVLAFDFGRVAPYFVGIGALLAVLSSASRGDRLLGIVNGDRAGFSVVFIGSVVASWTGTALLALHRFDSRNASVVLIGVVMAVVLAIVVLGSRRRSASRGLIIAGVCAAVSIGQFAGSITRAQIRSLAERSVGWSGSGGAGDDFRAIVRAAEPIARQIDVVARATDIVASARPPEGLPLISTLSGRRMLAERHIGAYFAEGSSMERRLRAQDEYGANGTTAALRTLNEHYCVKWYVAFRPNVLPAYAAPATVVYADATATLIEFPDPPGGTDCVPVDVRGD